MKISFRDNGEAQAPVKAVQTELRAAKPRHLPILRVALAIAAIAGIVTLVVWWWQGQSLRTYGMVAAHVVTVSAPARCRVEAQYAEVGDRVRAGTVLCVLVGDEAAIELRGVEETLAQERALLKELETTSNDPAIPAAVGGARVAEQRATATLAAAAQRLDEVRRLVRLQAATAADERIAAQAERDARFNLEAARLDAARSADEHTTKLAQVRSRIAAAEARAAHLRPLAGPTELRAPTDGVVVEVGAAAGSTVPAEGLLVSLSEASALWIDAYVPAGDGNRLARCTHALIYPTAGGPAQRGRIVPGQRVETRLPPLIADRIPRTLSGIHVRIECDDATGMTPGNVARVVMW